MNPLVANLPPQEWRRITRLLEDDRVKVILRFLDRQAATVSDVIGHITCSGGSMLTIRPATAYSHLRALEARQLVTLSRVDRTRRGRPRLFYQTTQLGQACLNTYQDMTSPLLCPPD